LNRNPLFGTRSLETAGGETGSSTSIRVGSDGESQTFLSSSTTSDSPAPLATSFDSKHFHGVVVTDARSPQTFDPVKKPLRQKGCWQEFWGDASKHERVLLVAVPSFVVLFFIIAFAALLSQHQSISIHVHFLDLLGVGEFGRGEEKKSFDNLILWCSPVLFKPGDRGRLQFAVRRF